MPAVNIARDNALEIDVLKNNEKMKNSWKKLEQNEKKNKDDIGKPILFRM